jgi:hypothetical protein
MSSSNKRKATEEPDRVSSVPEVHDPSKAFLNRILSQKLILDIPYRLDYYNLNRINDLHVDHALACHLVENDWHEQLTFPTVYDTDHNYTIFDDHIHVRVSKPMIMVSSPLGV